MHAYGTTNGIIVRQHPADLHPPMLTSEEAETLLRQLPVAIREHELAAIKQLTLVFPEEDAA